MKHIPLTRGLVAIVDDEDYDRLMVTPKRGLKRRWSAVGGNGYWYAKSRTGDGDKKIGMARAVLGTPQGLIIDHINHNTLDNRKSNLRIVTHGQNQQNRVKKAAARSRFKGVHWDPSCVGVPRPWRASIGTPSTTGVFYLGRHATEEQAALAYNTAATLLYGRHAHLNEVT